MNLGIKIVYLSPFLLKLQFVRGRTWPLRVLNSSKFCYCFYDILFISSDCNQGHTLDELSEEGLFAFGDYRLFGGDFLNKFVHFSSKSMRKVLLRGEVKQVDRFGLDLTVASHVLKQNSRRVVTDQELFQLHNFPFLNL